MKRRKYILSTCLAVSLVLFWWVPNWDTDDADVAVVLGYGFFYRDAAALDRYAKTIADYAQRHPRLQLIIVTGGSTYQGKG